MLQLPAAAPSGTHGNTSAAITATVGGTAVTGNAASDTLFVAAAPTLTKAFIGDPVGAGGSVVLRFTITNTSATSSATSIAFDDVFDNILPTASATPSGDFCGSGSAASFTPLSNPPPPADAVPAKLSVSGANLAPDGSCVFDITLDVLAGAPTGTYVNTTSAPTATVSGATVTGDAATDTLAVVSFSGAPPTAGVTVVKAVDIIELRSAVNTIRMAEGFAVYTFTDASLTVGVTRVKAEHLTELRLALNEVLAAKTLPLVAGDTDPALVSGLTILAADVAALRTGVSSLLAP